MRVQSDQSHLYDVVAHHIAAAKSLLMGGSFSVNARVKQTVCGDLPAGALEHTNDL